MDKLDRERSILESVYDPDNYAISHVDRPDFLLTRPGSRSSFGVEVTDLYPTESDARLMLHPEYIEELFAGGRHRHKDDITELPVVTLSISDADGTLKHDGITGIIRERKPDRTIGALLPAVLARKNAAAAHYKDGQSHVNLIVMDHTDTSPGPEVEYEADQLLSPAVVKELQNSPFREVFVASRTSDGHEFYRPLRLLWLLSSFFSFVRFLEQDESCIVRQEGDSVLLFVDAMRRLHMNANLAHIGRHLCAVHGGAAIHLAEGQATAFDIADRRPPARMHSLRQVLPDEELVELCGRYEIFIDDKTFRCQVVVKGRNR